MQTIPGTLFQKYYVGGCAVNTGFLISHSFYPIAKYARNIPTMLSYDKKEAVLVILLNVSRGSPCTVAGKIEIVQQASRLEKKLLSLKSSVDFVNLNVWARCWGRSWHLYFQDDAHFMLKCPSLL